jgi:hypothetical protein
MYLGYGGSIAIQHHPNRLYNTVQRFENIKRTQHNSIEEIKKQTSVLFHCKHKFAFWEKVPN